jgi:hypothetical protein
MWIFPLRRLPWLRFSLPIILSLAPVWCFRVI